MDKETKQEFKKMSSNMDDKFEEIGVMIKRGFDGVYETMDKRFNAVDERFDDLKYEMHEEFRKIHLEMKDIWSKLEEIEERLEKISQTSKEDTDAIVGDVFDLRQRVIFLENQVKELQNA